MPEHTTQNCPKCNEEVREKDYFCSNCGYNLKPKPPGTELSNILILMTKSLLLPPLGIYWALPYLRQTDPKSKSIGWMAIILTIVMLIVSFIWFKDLTDNLNKQLNQQFQMLNY